MIVLARTFNYCSITLLRLATHISVVHNRLRHMTACKCPVCGKEYNRKKDLERHAEHVHEGVKRFKCEQCDVACSQASRKTILLICQQLTKIRFRRREH